MTLQGPDGATVTYVVPAIDPALAVPAPESRMPINSCPSYPTDAPARCDSPDGVPPLDCRRTPECLHVQLTQDARAVSDRLSLREDEDYRLSVTLQCGGQTLFAQSSTYMCVQQF